MEDYSNKIARIKTFYNTFLPKPEIEWSPLLILKRISEREVVEAIIDDCYKNEYTDPDDIIYNKILYYEKAFSNVKSDEMRQRYLFGIDVLERLQLWI